MRSAFRRPSSLLLAVALLAGASVACAQDRPPPPSRPPTLAERLHLRPDQDAAWRAYQDELAQERADAERQARDLPRLNAMTTPERLDWTLQQLPERNARVHRSVEAVRTFYAALSPDQQRTFDRLSRLPASPAAAAGPGAEGEAPAPGARR